jgi:microsomal dipeptidase-like Zn-dependent dipeptidase
MEEKIFMDVTHASQNTIMDLIKITTHPFLSSHWHNATHTHNACTT